MYAPIISRCKLFSASMTILLPFLASSCFFTNRSRWKMPIKDCNYFFYICSCLMLKHFQNGKNEKSQIFQCLHLCVIKMHSNYPRMDILLIRRCGNLSNFSFWCRYENDESRCYYKCDNKSFFDILDHRSCFSYTQNWCNQCATEKFFCSEIL